MCLNLFPTQNPQPHKSNRTVAYKVLTKFDEKWVTPHKCHPVDLSKPLISNRQSVELTEHELFWASVDYGIHVYTTYAEALNSVDELNWDWFPEIPTVNGYYIFECDVDPADHVADGTYNEAVYMKISNLRLAIKPVTAPCSCSS